MPLSLRPCLVCACLALGKRRRALNKTSKTHQCLDLRLCAAVSSPRSVENGELILTVLIDRSKSLDQGHIKDESDEDYVRRILPEPVVDPHRNDEWRQNV